MATKSSNTKGNPYHDEGTGRFTSSGESGAKGAEQSGTPKMPSIRLKPNFDISSARSSLASQPQPPQNQPQPPQNQPIGQYKPAASVDEAIAIGKSILPGCEVNYSANCNVEKLNDLNMALSDIATAFPKFVSNGLLFAYGDGLSMDEGKLRKLMSESAIGVIKNDEFFKGVYDRFFESFGASNGLGEESRYSEDAIRAFMGFDRGFNPYEYVNQARGGGTLAYYQVSMDNIFNPGAGGKGINGAVKFYNSILQNPTRSEISNAAYAVDSGFHFDYGGHSYTYATGVHELGHSIFTIAYKKCNDAERAEINELLREGSGRSRSQVSGYGRTNAYEQEAEAVADAMCRGAQATPHNRKMFAWLKKVHRRLEEENGNR